MSRAKTTIITALAFSLVLHILAWWLLSLASFSPPRTERATILSVVLTPDSSVNSTSEATDATKSEQDNSVKSNPQTDTPEASVAAKRSESTSNNASEPAQQAPAPARDSNALGQNASPAKESASDQDSLRLPASVTLFYEAVEGLPKGGKIEGYLKWSHQDSQYQIELVVNAQSTQLALFRSEGSTSAMGLQPEKFSLKLLQSAMQQSTFTGTKVATAYLQTRQDPLSVIIQLAAILSSDPKKFRIVNRLEIPIHDVRIASTGLLQEPAGNPSGPETATFRLQPEIDVSTPLANMQVKPVTQSHTNASTSTFAPNQADVWLAQQLDYLPAKLVLSIKTPTDGGVELYTSLDMRLKQVQRP